MTRVVFLLVPQVHLLDLAGPAQVFSTAADLGLGYELAYVAERADVPSAQGVPLRAGTDWPALDPDDLVLVPVVAAAGRATAMLMPAAAKTIAPLLRVALFIFGLLSRFG